MIELLLFLLGLALYVGAIIVEDIREREAQDEQRRSDSDTKGREDRYTDS